MSEMASLSCPASLLRARATRCGRAPTRWSPHSSLTYRVESSRPAIRRAPPTTTSSARATTFASSSRRMRSSRGSLVGKALRINKIGHALHDLDPVFSAFSRTPALAALVAALGISDAAPPPVDVHLQAAAHRRRRRSATRTRRSSTPTPIGDRPLVCARRRDARERLLVGAAGRPPRRLAALRAHPRAAHRTEVLDETPFPAEAAATRGRKGHAGGAARPCAACQRRQPLAGLAPRLLPPSLLGRERLPREQLAAAQDSAARFLLTKRLSVVVDEAVGRDAVFHVVVGAARECDHLTLAEVGLSRAVIQSRGARSWR